MPAVEYYSNTNELMTMTIFMGFLRALGISIGAKGISMWTAMPFTCKIAFLRNIKVVYNQPK
jgi:hypothetical protein